MHVCCPGHFILKNSGGVLKAGSLYIEKLMMEDLGKEE